MTAEERAALCTSICAKPADTSGATPMSCGSEASCVTDLCDSTGYDTSCLLTLDGWLTCLNGVDPSEFTCGTNGINVDDAGYNHCFDYYYPIAACHG
jgi:hypothetical protein